jgi:hypothetical protein
VTQPDTNDEQRLIGYLLGQLNAEEQAQIEERYLSDPGFHDELEAAERDLIDRYVRGELSDPEPFEKRYLSSPRRRQRVEFARALMQSLDAAAARAEQAADRTSQVGRTVPGRVETSPGPLAARLPVVARLPRLSMRGWLPAAAAAAILLAAWALASRPAPDGSDRNPDETPQQAAGAPTTRTDPAPEPRPPEPSAAAGSNPIATLVLVPSLTRESGVTPTLVLDPDVVPQLQLALEPPDYPTYRTVLRTADGTEVFRADGLQPVTTANGEALVITLPVGLLRDDDYIIMLTGVTAGGELEAAAGYYFRAQLK